MYQWFVSIHWYPNCDYYYSNNSVYYSKFKIKRIRIVLQYNTRFTINIMNISVDCPYKTSRITTLTTKWPEFSTSKDITWQVDMDSGKFEELVYDMIIGRDLLQALEVVIDFEYQVIKWDNISYHSHEQN